MRKNRKNKTLVNRFDLGRIPVQTSPDIQKPETLLQLAERMQREEQDRINAPVKAAERELTATLRQRDVECRRVWTLPVEKLRQLDRDVLEISMPSFDVVTTNYNLDDESATRKGQEAKRTLDDFINTLPQRGIHLNNDGVSRFRLLVSALAVFRSAAITPDLLQTAFSWMVECFGDELHVEPQSVVEPTETTKPLTIADCLRQGLDGSRESDRRLKQAVENDFVSETGVLADQFLAHLRDVWGFTPDNASWRYLFSPVDGWVVRMNKSLMDPRTFDACRLHMSSTNRWPSTMQTARENLDREFRRDGNWGVYKYKLNALERKGLLNRPMTEAKDILGIE